MSKPDQVRMTRGAPGFWSFACPICHMVSQIEPLVEPLTTCQHYVEIKQIELEMFAVFQTRREQRK